jgi:WS/DGAT C-terminal domain
MALGAAVMSYVGQLSLTAVADRDRCPDVEVFAEGVCRALDDLAQQPAQPGQADDQAARPASR